MADLIENTNVEPEDNRIAIEDLPVNVTAYEDDNGFALVIRSKDARIGNADGRLVNDFLVRIARGDVPKPAQTTSVKIAEGKSRTVIIASIHMDETGRLFVTDADTNTSHPMA